MSAFEPAYNETICFVHFIGERNGTGSNASAGFYGHSSGDTMYPLSLIIKTSKSNWLSVYSYANWGSDGYGSYSQMSCHARYWSNNMQGNEQIIPNFSFHHFSGFSIFSIS